MAQNTSHAVMAQRSEAADSLDHFPTPPWAVRALCEWLANYRMLRYDSAWEPACAEGYMARALAEYFGDVYSSDVHDYGFGVVSDFLWPSDRRADWIITNPPFRLAEQFATTAIERSYRGAAMLVRTAFLEGAARHRGLFAPYPPSDVLQFVERVPMHKGRLVKNGSTATAYCWIVWRKDAPCQTHFHWLAPCRKRLERDSDYALAAGKFDEAAA
jgi:hypothetical protein